MTTTTMMPMTVVKIGGCNAVSLRQDGALASWKAAAAAACVAYRRKKGLSVRSVGGGSHVSVEKVVNGRKVNGSDCTINVPQEYVSGGVDDESMKAFKLGRFVEGSFVYRQTFVIRSYEIGPDNTATMETLMNLLQETALNHVMGLGLASDGFGATHEMSLRKLIWVVTRINIQVDKGDVVEIDTWVAASGKNSMRRDWAIRDYNTQKIITRATSTWVLMNRETRRLSKMPEQVREEVKPFFLDRPIINPRIEVEEKIDKLNEDTAQNIRSGLAPRWSDMDVNQHINNVKYIGWILESVPLNVLEDYHLSSMTLEYRRECRQSNLLESLTSMETRDGDAGERHAPIESARARKGELGSTHLLRLQENKAEVVRAIAEWRAKQHI